MEVSLNKSTSFQEWKAITISKLSEIAEKVKDSKLRSDINHIIIHLSHCDNLSKLVDILKFMHILRDYHGLPEITAIIPSQEELKKWFREANI